MGKQAWFQEPGGDRICPKKLAGCGTPFGASWGTAFFLDPSNLHPSFEVAAYQWKRNTRFMRSFSTAPRPAFLQSPYYKQCWSAVTLRTASQCRPYPHHHLLWTYLRHYLVWLTVACILVGNVAFTTGNSEPQILHNTAPSPSRRNASTTFYPVYPVSVFKMNSQSHGEFHQSPSDFPPSYLAQNRQTSIVAENVAMCIIAIAAVALRFYARKVSKAGFWWDDWVTLMALPYSLAINIFSAECKLSRLNPAVGMD